MPNGLIDVPFIRTLEQHCQIPKGWGVAYIDYRRMGAIIAPIPFNLLISLAMRAYVFAIRGGNKRVYLNSQKHYVNIKHRQEGMSVTEELKFVGYTHSVR